MQMEQQMEQQIKSKKYLYMMLILLTYISMISWASAEEFRVSDSTGLMNKEAVTNNTKSDEETISIAEMIIKNGTNEERMKVAAADHTVYSNTESQNQHHNYTIYNAHSRLIGDNDDDGYYQKFSIVFDADSDSSSWQTVFAKLYLSNDGGNTWLHYFTTDSFIIESDHSYDDYKVVTTLHQGYPAGEYDVLIDLYEDKNDELIVATYSHLNSSELAALPLESVNFDSSNPKIKSKSKGSGGGSSSWQALIYVMLLLIARKVTKDSY